MAVSDSRRPERWFASCLDDKRACSSLELPPRNHPFAIVDFANIVIENTSIFLSTDNVLFCIAPRHVFVLKLLRKLVQCKFQASAFFDRQTKRIEWNKQPVIKIKSPPKLTCFVSCVFILLRLISFLRANAVHCLPQIFQLRTKTKKCNQALFGAETRVAGLVSVDAASSAATVPITPRTL